MLGLSRRRAAAARREADERLLPPRAHRQPLARLGATDGARCRSAPISVSRATASGSSTPCRRRVIRASWLGTFQAALDSSTEVSEEALSCIQQHVDRYRADDFFADAHDRAALLRFLAAARRTLRAALADARLRAARARVPRIPGDFVAGGARLLSQVHGRRAHAADDPEPRTADHDRRRRSRCGSDRSRGPRRSPNCSCWRCCFTTWASGATTITRSRACGWPSTCSTACRSPAMQRDTVLFLIRHHLRMSLAAFRRDTEDPDIVKQFAALVGTEERLKMLCLHDARRHRGGQPRHADAVEGGAPLAAVRRHLQPPDAAVRRRADRAESRRGSTNCSPTGPTT